jgi:phage gpG-like protein
MNQGKDALGNPWEPLDPATVRAKGHATPLVDTQTLLDDLQASSTFNRGAKTAVIGSSLRYAPIHEFGAPEAGIPRRPFLDPAAMYAQKNAVDVIGRTIDVGLAAAEL